MKSDKDYSSEGLDLTYLESFLDKDYETSIFCSCYHSSSEKDSESLTFCPICGKLILKA